MSKSISVLNPIEREITSRTGVNPGDFLNTKLRAHSADGTAYSDETAGEDGPADHQTLLSRAADHISCAMDDDDDMPPRERIGRAMQCLSSALEKMPHDDSDNTGDDGADHFLAGAAHFRTGVRVGGR